MNLYDITENDIQEIADSSAIFSRGRKYYFTGKIKSMKLIGDKITARVIGNYGTYHVGIYIEDGEIEAHCDCPYGGYGCKHIVAVLLKWCREEKEYSCKKVEQKKIKIQDIITVQFIEKEVERKILAKSFGLVTKGCVKIKQPKEHKIDAKVKDIQTEIVTINSGPHKDHAYFRCSCIKPMWGDRMCKHIAAVFLELILQKSKKRFEKFEEKIRSQLNQERLNELVSNLETIRDEEESNQKKYKFSFQVTKRQDSIAVSVLKAMVCKSGCLGKTSLARENHVKMHYSEMSKTKQRTLNLFSYSLRESFSYYPSNPKLSKSNFEKDIDFDVLRLMKEVYEEDPKCFMNCSFPEEKGQMQIEIRKNGKRDFIFTVLVRLNEKIFSADNDKISIFGKNTLWADILDKETDKHILFEISCENPGFVKRLQQYTGIEMDSHYLKNFIEKYYLKLSSTSDVILPKAYAVEEKPIEPRPRIFLKDYGNSFSIALRFLYGSHEIDHGSSHNIIFKNKEDKMIKIKRDMEKEKEYYSTLLEKGVAEKNDVLIPLGDPCVWLVDAAKDLITQGYEIYGKESLFYQNINSHEPELTVNVTSGIDWFDLKGEASFGREKVSFNKIIDSLAEHERFIKLSDGTTGVIPKKWLNKLAGVTGLLNYNVKEKKATASNSQIAIVEALLDIATKSKTDKQFMEIRKKFKSFKKIQNVPLPKGLQGQLRQYQKAGYDWLHFLQEFSFGGCLADDMGLGKTVQVLSLLLYQNEMGNKTPSLIVVPTSLIFNWVNEVKKFTPSLKVYVHHGQNRLKKISQIIKKKKPDLILSTYGTIRNDIEIFKQKKFHYVVLDESQQIKNPLSKNAKSILNLKSKYRLVLTGTPVENNSLDLWSQFAFLNPGLLGSMDYFKKTFVKSIEKEKNKDKTFALKNVINPFLLCRKKELVAQDLPEKQITTIYCEMEKKQREIYEYWKEKLKNEINESIQEKGFMQSRMKIFQGLTKLRQICNHAVLVDESFVGESGKLNLIVKQIEEVMSEGHKILVFSSFVKMLKLFKTYFVQQNIAFTYLDGSTKKRKEVVEEFQENPKVKVFLISLKAGGLGLNLTAADYVFIVDPWWNPAAEMQAIDRAHRIGQTNNVFVYKTITKDSVEEKILELQESKLELVKNIITIEKGVFKKLGQDDVHNLFK